MMMIALMILVLVGFYALFGVLINFADRVIRLPSVADSGRNGAPPRR